MSHIPRILIVGGGYVGMYTALRLQRRLRRGEARVTVVDADSYMTYQPFLPEAAAGNIEPRHVVVPLRRVLHKCEIVNGWAAGVDLRARTLEVHPHQGPPRTLPYDILVFAPGSVSRLLPIPGVAECGIGFKTVEEAIHLRNHVLAQLDLAASTETERKTYRHAYAGSVASLGLHRGVAQIYGRKLRGFPAWFMHRTYHLSRVPTFNRKVRVLIDWTLALFFRREITSLGALSHPREEFEFAARPESRIPERAEHPSPDGRPGVRDAQERLAAPAERR